MRVSNRGVIGRRGNPAEYFQGDSALKCCWPLIESGMDIVGKTPLALTAVTFSEGSAYFNGTSSFGVTGNINLTATNKVTFLADVKIHAYNLTAQKIIAETSVAPGSNAGTITIQQNGTLAGDPIFIGANGNVGQDAASYYLARNNMVDKNLHLMVSTFDMSLGAGSEVNYFQDGVLFSADVRVSFNNTANFGNFPLYVGARAGTSAFSNISVKNMALFTRVLSSEEIADFYAWSKDIRMVA